MADFAVQSSIEDWSLQAIVRGSSGDFSKLVGLEMEGGDSFIGTYYDHPQNLDDLDFLASLPEFLDVCNNSGSSDELEYLYKPFYPENNDSYVPDHQQSFVAQQQQKSTYDVDNVVEEDKKPHEVSSDQSSNCDGYTPKYKKRKNQHKRVVIRVSAEGLSSDMWAWRKYGQKPIKGSPYPRSYYRCSSSKGCLARKQVEESYADPGTFILTYTAEHNHGKPTRRNSLAGTVRQKFPSKREKEVEGSSRNSSPPKAVVNTQSTSNHDLVFGPQARTKDEARDDGNKGDLNRMENDDCDLMLNEDFFSGLEDFDDFISGSACHTPAQQTLPIRS